MYIANVAQAQLPVAPRQYVLAHRLPPHIKFGARVMVETDLERLLEDGARRLRLQRALRFGLIALGCGVLVAALAIFLLRMFPLQGAMPGLQMTLIQLAIA